MEKLVFEEMLTKKGYKYHHGGLITMTGGDKRQALGSVLQCLLAVKPLKDYFIDEEYAQIGPRANRGVDTILSQFFTGIARRMYMSDIKYVKEETVMIDDIHNLYKAGVAGPQQRKAPTNAASVLGYVLNRLEDELTPDPENVNNI